MDICKLSDYFKTRPFTSNDRPEDTEYVCHKETKALYKVLGGKQLGPLFYPIWTIQKGSTTFDIDWRFGSAKEEWLLVDVIPVPQQLAIHSQKRTAALSKKEACMDILTLHGKEGKVRVFRHNALMVSDSFKNMVLRAQKNQLKVELGTQALEYFKNYIHCEYLDASKLDAVSFAELVDIAEMYMIEHFVDILVEVMTPTMKELSEEEIYPHVAALARLPGNILVPFLKAWRGN